MYTVWHVDRYKITFKLVINSRRTSRGPVYYRPVFRYYRPVCLNLCQTADWHILFPQDEGPVTTYLLVNSLPFLLSSYISPLTPNDPYRDRTAPLTSKRSILYIYSTNKGTEYFKHASSSKCSLFHNSNLFGSCIIHILYIYSTDIGTEYFKHGIYSPYFSLQNAVCFIILTYMVPVLSTFYIFIQQI